MAKPRLEQGADHLRHLAKVAQTHTTAVVTAARTHIAAALEQLHRATRRARQAVAPYVIGLGLAGGAATILAPAFLIAASGISILTYRPAPPPVAVAPPVDVLPPDVTFLERFHTLDETRWQASDGWDNGYWNWSDWRRSALRPSNDGLAIVMEPNPPGASKEYAGGELQSNEHFQYGYFEVRMRVPRGSGIVAGFFSYTEPQGRASQQEIDIEFVGSRTRQIEFGYHLGRHSVGQRIHLPFDATEGFHTYAFEWTPDGIRWYVDNRLTHTIADAGAQQLTSPERLYLSLSASRIAVWTGELDRTLAPWRMDVTCVAHARAYHGQSICDPRSSAQR